MSDTSNHLVILTELEEKARSGHRRSSNSMHYSSQRRSRRDSIRSSKCVGSHGNSTAATSRASSMSDRSLRSVSSSSGSERSFGALTRSTSSRMRSSHLNLMDELQEKVARMNDLSSGTKKSRSESGNWRRSSRRSHGSPHKRRSSSLSSSERSVGSVGSGVSSTRAPMRGTREVHTKRRSSSSGARTSSSSSRDIPPSMPPRDNPPRLPSRGGNTSNLPEKERLTWTPRSNHQSRRRSPSSGAGAAGGSFQVANRNISLSSPNYTRDGDRARRSSAASSRGSTNSTQPARATPSVPGAIRVNSIGEISLLSSSSNVSLDDSVRSEVLSLSSSSHHEKSLDGTRSSGSSSSRRSSRSSRSRHRSSSSRHCRTLDSSLHSWPEDNEEENDDCSFAANTAHSRGPVLISVNEEPGVAPTIAASVAEDYERELDVAREEGRREALAQGTTRHNITDHVIIAVARDHDDESQDSVVDEKKIRKVLCWAFMLCCLLITAGVAVTALLFIGKGSRQMVIPAEAEDFDSNLKGVIIYNPPTQEECDAIANGTILEAQKSLIQKHFDIQIDITLASGADFGPLLSDLINLIQEKLIPVMAGCQAIDFFDATIAIADGITATTNATSAIVNGQIQVTREESCADDPIGNCRSYVLILDLYLEEDRSNSVLLEAIGATVTSEDIVNTLGLMYPVQAATVPAILAITDATNEATTAPEPTQDSVTSPPVTAPTLAPPSHVPTAAPTGVPSMLVTADSDPETPIAAPTEAPVSQVTAPPSKATTTSPVNVPTVAPVNTTTVPLSSQVDVPTDYPTRRPTRSPTSTPTRSPTKSLTNKPTEAPTGAPTAKPTPVPTPPPTGAPTPGPTPPPTPPPTNAPTPPPTKPPTLAPTEPVPTPLVPVDFCCSRDFLTCGGVEAACTASQASCESCNNAAWIEFGACTTGLGRNDDCTDNESGCCVGTCTPMGNGIKQCRL